MSGLGSVSCDGCIGGSICVGFALFVVLSAGGDVAFVASCLYLRPEGYFAALGIDAHVHDGFPAAVAHGLDLVEFICPGEQVAASFEGLSLKVAAQPVG